jgi:hypothetical protein
MKILGHILGLVGIACLLTALFLTVDSKQVIDAKFLTQEQLDHIIMLSNANARLQYDYKVYNYDYFYYDLPENTIVMCGPHKSVLNENHSLAFTTRAKDRHFIIVVDEVYCDSSMEYDKLLLHEMCHIRTWHEDNEPDGHGPLFHAEIRRLIRIGAFDNLL